MKLRKAKNKSLVKEALAFKPWDFGFMLDFEAKILNEMYKYFSTHDIIEGEEFIARDCKLAHNLVEIIQERDSSYDADYKPRVTTYKKLKYVNTRNKARFGYENYTEEQLENLVLADSLRQEKAWYLYNKLRMDRMRKWWD